MIKIRCVSTGTLLAAVALIALPCAIARADEPPAGEEQPSSTVGPGKAVEAASKKDGLRLLPTALKALDIQTTLLKGEAGEFTVPAGAMVTQLGESYVYRLRDGWFKFIAVAVIRRTEAGRVVRSKELRAGDLVVSRNADLVRLAELEVWGGAEGGD